MNAAANAATLARLAGVPLPAMKQENFSFLVWTDGPRWGHIDLCQWKVTEWNGNFHVRIY